LIYIAHGFALKQLAAALQPWLSLDERKRAQDYASTARQLQYLSGRGLLRWLACQMTSAAPSDVHIQRQDNGAPLLAIAATKLSCSISHKDDAVMVALGNVASLGIDIEKMQLRKRHKDLLKEFNDGFMQGVASTDLAAFYQRWTLAESVTKAQQGKLLATLRESFAKYADQAVFHSAQDHMLCCYASCEQGVLGAGHQWWQVTTTDNQAIRPTLVLETN
jgi:phosphopantetheinyl transferase